MGKASNFARHALALTHCWLVTGLLLSLAVHQFRIAVGDGFLIAGGMQITAAGGGQGFFLPPPPLPSWPPHGRPHRQKRDKAAGKQGQPPPTMDASTRGIGSWALCPGISSVGAVVGRLQHGCIHMEGTNTIEPLLPSRSIISHFFRIRVGVTSGESSRHRSPPERLALVWFLAVSKSQSLAQVGRRDRSGGLAGWLPGCVAHCPVICPVICRRAEQLEDGAVHPGLGFGLGRDGLDRASGNSVLASFGLC
ncbi:hypothetical protein F5144DRAFT_66681 [Chaetomium tenue]|uniref:Uncharacterized protein n=1 Tax=Chaetomium tenue TaxID=1854479 RepID=A0ACB7PT32_9PEZI|nr:hypothetical protein F5144DRAFT_66681 [Chaetomium globosum]